MKILKKILLAMTLISLTACINYSVANEPPTASSNGRYDGLIQELSCPSDGAKYGYFHDYGYWQGGEWCGQVGRAGYWVWLDSTWYVWARKLY